MSGKRVAIVQSSYIPWKGYFDLIRSVDAFILLDDVQLTKRDWRSRNRIKTQHGLAWLSIPIHTRGRYNQLIRDATISDPGWGRRHWQTLRACYAKTRHFDLYSQRFETLYQAPHTSLSHVNLAFITAICETLDIVTPITWSTDYKTGQGRTERLIDLCTAVGGTEDLSGPSAKAYLDVDAFAAAGITARYVDYEGYPEYSQPHGQFEHHVSVLDLIFCTGPRALEFMKVL